MAVGKNWWWHFVVAGGKHRNEDKAHSGVSFLHMHHFRNNLIGMSYPKKLYPTIKHLPSFRRNVDVFADLER